MADGKGVTTVYAASLREAEGAGRLTVGINEKISRSLASRGLGHVPFKPSDLPTSQWSEVRIFDKTAPLGAVILAAHQVGKTRTRSCGRPSTAQRRPSSTRCVRSWRSHAGRGPGPLRDRVLSASPPGSRRTYP